MELAESRIAERGLGAVYLFSLGHTQTNNSFCRTFKDRLAVRVYQEQTHIYFRLTLHIFLFTNIPSLPRVPKDCAFVSLIATGRSSSQPNINIQLAIIVYWIGVLLIVCCSLFRSIGTRAPLQLAFQAAKSSNILSPGTLSYSCPYELR